MFFEKLIFVYLFCLDPWSIQIKSSDKTTINRSIDFDAVAAIENGSVGGALTKIVSIKSDTFKRAVTCSLTRIFDSTHSGIHKCREGKSTMLKEQCPEAVRRWQPLKTAGRKGPRQKLREEDTRRQKDGAVCKCACVYVWRKKRNATHRLGIPHNPILLIGISTDRPNRINAGRKGEDCGNCC